MIDESIRLRLSQTAELDLSKLLAFMETTGIEYRNTRLINALGMATIDCIHIDVSANLGDRFLSFIILHETAHFKRISKFGKKFVIDMFSIADFDVFAEHIINEEIIADRYARLCYYQLNNVLFPVEYTQQLHIPYRYESYKQLARRLFGSVTNEETYRELMNSFIYEVR